MLRAVCAQPARQPCLRCSWVMFMHVHWIPWAPVVIADAQLPVVWRPPAARPALQAQAGPPQWRGQPAAQVRLYVIATSRLEWSRPLEGVSRQTSPSHHCCWPICCRCIVSSPTGRGVFDGNVRVNRLAQKTDAQQLSRNLLLVPRATVNVKPNLQVPQGARENSLGCCPSCSLLGASPAGCTSSFVHSSLTTITDPTCLLCASLHRSSLTTSSAPTAALCPTWRRKSCSTCGECQL